MCNRYGQSNGCCENCGTTGETFSPLIVVCDSDGNRFFITASYVDGVWTYTDSNTGAELTAGVDFFPCVDSSSASQPSPQINTFEACAVSDGSRMLVHTWLDINGAVTYQDVSGNAIVYGTDFVICPDNSQPAQITSTTVCVEFNGEVLDAIQHIRFNVDGTRDVFQTWTDGADIDPPLTTVPCPNVISNCGCK